MVFNVFSVEWIFSIVREITVACLPRAYPRYPWGDWMPTRVKLNKTEIDALNLPEGKAEDIAWDTELRGFGVRYKASGVKSFLIQYRNWNGVSKRHTFAKFGVMTAEEARKHARNLLSDVAKGGDPAEERRAAKKAETVKDLCDAYFRAGDDGRLLKRNGRPKKASTLKVDKGRINRHVTPLIGKKLISEISQATIRKVLVDIASGKTATVEKTGPHGKAVVTGGEGAAGRAIAVLSSIFTWGIRVGSVERNPCQGVELPVGEVKERFLSPEEYKALGSALGESADINEIARAAIKAIALTGARRSEILTLRPQDIDRDAGGLRLADTKSGRQLRPCGANVLKWLSELEFSTTEWVFPASRGDGPLVNIRKPLAAVVKAADIEGVTAHTLRHSFATVAAELEYSELTIAGLLGHTQKGVTQRYAHRVDRALSAAAERVSSVVLARMEGMVSDSTMVRLATFGEGRDVG